MNDIQCEITMKDITSDVWHYEVELTCCRCGQSDWKEIGGLGSQGEGLTRVRLARYFCRWTKQPKGAVCPVCSGSAWPYRFETRDGVLALVGPPSASDPPAHDEQVYGPLDRMYGEETPMLTALEFVAEHADRFESAAGVDTFLERGFDAIRILAQRRRKRRRVDIFSDE